MKRIIVVVVVVLAAGVAGFAQEQTSAGAVSMFASATEIQQRLQLAISTEEYPVTPGDVYRLTYTQANAQLVQDILVESNYIINMKVFGSVNAAGMTFAALKPMVEKAVAAAYPRSMPSLAIYSLGIFQVYVKGELPQSQTVVAWGLTKLSEIVEPRRGQYASLRDVRVVSKDGKEKVYDLFKAARLGSADEDPFVRPGDTIVLSRSARKVEIVGEVHRPGTYDLVGSDQLRELVEFYGGGLTENSDASRVRIERMTGDRARIVYTSLDEGYQRGFVLENGDIVTLAALSQSLPVISFEGAVAPPAAGTDTAAAADATAAGVTPEYRRIVYTFKEGETLSDAFRAIRASIAPLADLSSVSVLREGVAQPVVVDARQLLEKAVSPADIVLKANDRVVIPYLRFSVFVSGAVENPGTYPYAPGRTYHYYITLAGGSSQDAPDKVYITDVNGKMREQKEVIQPEDRIFIIPAEVMVQGAVFAPSSFSYREGLPVWYYINLAGGIDPERNSNRKILHYDSSGNRKQDGAQVAAGDRLYVPNTSFVYNFNRYAPMVVTILGLVLTSLEIYSMWPQ